MPSIIQTKKMVQFSAIVILPPYNVKLQPSENYDMSSDFLFCGSEYCRTGTSHSLPVVAHLALKEDFINHSHFVLMYRSIFSLSPWGESVAFMLALIWRNMSIRFLKQLKMLQKRIRREQYEYLNQGRANTTCTENHAKFTSMFNRWNKETQTNKQT